MLNLEPLAALAANEMAGHDPQRANDAENIITKSLAVLAEQGLYAFGLFLATRKREQDRTPAQRIDQEARRLLQSHRAGQRRSGARARHAELLPQPHRHAAGRIGRRGAAPHPALEAVARDDTDLRPLCRQGAEERWLRTR
jgi:hypothetical protein